MSSIHFSFNEFYTAICKVLVSTLNSDITRFILFVNIFNSITNNFTLEVLLDASRALNNSFFMTLWEEE